jgi:hypothetical protein
MTSEMIEQTDEQVLHPETKDMEPGLTELHINELSYVGGGCVTWAFH